MDVGKWYKWEGKALQGSWKQERMELFPFYLVTSSLNSLLSNGELHSPCTHPSPTSHLPCSPNIRHHSPLSGPNIGGIYGELFPVTSLYVILLHITPKRPLPFHLGTLHLGMARGASVLLFFSLDTVYQPTRAAHSPLAARRGPQSLWLTRLNWLLFVEKHHWKSASLGEENYPRTETRGDGWLGRWMLLHPLSNLLSSTVAQTNPFLPR